MNAGAFTNKIWRILPSFRENPSWNPIVVVIKTHSHHQLLRSFLRASSSTCSQSEMYNIIVLRISRTNPATESGWVSFSHTAPTFVSTKRRIGVTQVSGFEIQLRCLLPIILYPWLFHLDLNHMHLVSVVNPTFTGHDLKVWYTDYKVMHDFIYFKCSHYFFLILYLWQVHFIFLSRYQ